MGYSKILFENLYIEHIIYRSVIPRFAYLSKWTIVVRLIVIMNRKLKIWFYAGIFILYGMNNQLHINTIFLHVSYCFLCPFVYLRFECAFIIFLPFSSRIRAITSGFPNFTKNSFTILFGFVLGSNAWVKSLFALFKIFISAWPGPTSKMSLFDSVSNFSP